MGSRFGENLGFTLIEMLVVVGLMGILTVMVILYINPSIQLKRSRDNQRIAEIKQIQSALEEYKGDKGIYPAFGSASSPTYGWAGVGSIFLNTAGGSAGASATVTYLRNIPTGPKTEGNACNGYVYAVPSGGRSYTIFIKLEDTNGSYAQAVKTAPTYPAGTLSSDGKTYYFSSGTCSGVDNTFNYWVTNP